MPNMIDVELWIAMNEDGDWIVNSDESEAIPNLLTDFGGCSARVIKVTVQMAPPVIPEVSVAVPDEAGKTVEVPHVGD